MITINDLKFPVIFFSQNLIFIFKKTNDLTTCGIQALRQNFYKNMIIVDSNRKKNIVINANKIRYSGPFWGFRLFVSRQVKVELLFKDEQIDISLEELKRMLCNTINKRRIFWESTGSIVDLKDKINRAETFDDIINLPFFNSK